MENGILKTVAAFLNSDGGTLLNSTNKLSQPSEIKNYSQTRWPPQL